MTTSPSTFWRVPVFVLLLAAVTSIGAMAQPTVSVRGNVGASFFRSPDGLSEVLHSGVDLGLGAGVEVYRGLSVTVHGGYDQFTLNEQTIRLVSQNFQGEDEDGLSQGNLSFLSGGLGVRYTYRNETDAHPYATIGGGIYRLKDSNRKTFKGGELIGQAEDLTFTKVGVHLALGSSFRIDDTYAVFFEPRYVFYNVREEWSGTLRYFTLRLGVDVRLN